SHLQYGALLLWQPLDDDVVSLMSMLEDLGRWVGRSAVAAKEIHCKITRQIDQPNAGLLAASVKTGGLAPDLLVDCDERPFSGCKVSQNPENESEKQC